MGQGTLYDENGNKLGCLQIVDVNFVQPIESKPDVNIDYFKQAAGSFTITAMPMTQAHMLDILLPQKDAKWTLQVPVIIPNRRHHKKRIQKKWLKKYGYTESYKSVDVDVRYGDCSGMGQMNGEVQICE